MFCFVFYCDKHWQKPALGGKDLFGLHFTQSIIEEKQGRKLKMGPGSQDQGEALLPGWLLLACSDCVFLIQPFQGWHLPQWTGPSHIFIKRMSYRPAYRPVLPGMFS